MSSSPPESNDGEAPGGGEKGKRRSRRGRGRGRKSRAGATAGKGEGSKAAAPKKRGAKKGSGKGAAAKGDARGGRVKSKGPKRGGRVGEREFSAGGVVVDGEQVVVIVPTRRAADGSKVLALPKGHVDPGETPIEAAGREVREETGLVAEPVVELGESRYWYRRDGKTIGKTVSFFLFEMVDGDIADHDDEVEEVRWIGLRDAETELSHTAEREMVTLALAYLSKDR